MTRHRLDAATERTRSLDGKSHHGNRKEMKHDVVDWELKLDCQFVSTKQMQCANGKNCQVTLALTVEKYVYCNKQ